MGTVRYGKTYNLGNYESERIDREDEVQDDESPAMAIKRLKAWVEEQHHGSDYWRKLEIRREEVQQHISGGRMRLRYLLAKHAEAVQKFEQLRDILASHGVVIAPLGPHELPMAMPDDQALDDQALDEDEDEDEDEDDEDNPL